MAAAIFAFGTIYGASQAGVVPPLRAVASSLLIFSGAAQFTAASLTAAGAGVVAILATVAVLNARHVLLGAVLRQRLRASAAQRSALAFVMIDETVGLALGARERTREVYLVAGVLCYLAWVGGTAVGVLGGAALDDPALAEAVFPVLFVGLAAASARDRSDLVRAAGALVVTVALALVVGDLGGLLPILVAVAVAATMRWRR